MGLCASNAADTAAAAPTPKAKTASTTKTNANDTPSAPAGVVKTGGWKRRVSLDAGGIAGLGPAGLQKVVPAASGDADADEIDTCTGCMEDFPVSDMVRTQCCKMEVCINCASSDVPGMCQACAKNKEKVAQFQTIARTPTHVKLSSEWTDAVKQEDELKKKRKDLFSSERESERQKKINRMVGKNDDGKMIRPNLVRQSTDMVAGTCMGCLRPDVPKEEMSTSSCCKTELCPACMEQAEQGNCIVCEGRKEHGEALSRVRQGERRHGDTGA